MGYKFQFITLAGFHSLNYSMFNLAYGYARNQMSAFRRAAGSRVRRRRRRASRPSSTSARSAPATSTP
jgi:isocitrate lyase